MLQCPAPERRHTPCTKHTRDGKHLEGPNTPETPFTKGPAHQTHQAPQHPMEATQQAHGHPRDTYTKHLSTPETAYTMLNWPLARVGGSRHRLLPTGKLVSLGVGIVHVTFVKVTGHPVPRLATGRAKLKAFVLSLKDVVEGRAKLKAFVLSFKTLLKAELSSRPLAHPRRTPWSRSISP